MSTLREQFEKETGLSADCGADIIKTDYVEWLESKLETVTKQGVGEEIIWEAWKQSAIDSNNFYNPTRTREEYNSWLHDYKYHNPSLFLPDAGKN